MNIYMKHPITMGLAVAQSIEEQLRWSQAGYVKIGRAQWRQLKREQKALRLRQQMVEDAKRILG